MPARYVAHLDMDAFYASVELLRCPELRGLPLVIGGRRRGPPDGPVPRLRGYAGRGVITTATYEARQFGVHSGMGLMKAAKLAPDALILPADFDEYRRYSRMFKEAVRAIAPYVEDRGIDEIYIDLTEIAESPAVHPSTSHVLSVPPFTLRQAQGEREDTVEASGRTEDGWERAREIAASIQRAVRDATGLSCSIGVTPNKLLSE